MAAPDTPTISVVVETFTISHEYPAMDIDSSPLRVVLDRLHRQASAIPHVEIIVIVEEHEAARYEPLKVLFPSIHIAPMPEARYFSMKNHGIDLARGEIVALLDGDCVPTEDWLNRIVASIENGADVVAGKTRYRSDKLLANTFSVFDFGHAQGNRHGRAVYFNANNLAFRTQVVRQNKFDGRARRNGACYHLWLRLARQNYKMVYDPGQFASHGYDIEGLGFVSKHLERGFDAIRIIRTDTTGVMPGSRLMWLGIFAPVAMAMSRVVFDFKRIISNREDLGIRWYAIPYYYCVSLLIREIEMLGGMIAIVRPDYYK